MSNGDTDEARDETLSQATSKTNILENDYNEDETKERMTKGTKMLYTVAEVPPGGVLVSVALQVITPVVPRITFRSYSTCLGIIIFCFQIIFFFQILFQKYHLSVKQFKTGVVSTPYMGSDYTQKLTVDNKKSLSDK